MKRSGLTTLLAGASLSILATACTVKLQAPDKPIHIIGDFTIKHEIVVKVERELDKALSEDSGLF